DDLGAAHLLRRQLRVRPAELQAPGARLAQTLRPVRLEGPGSRPGTGYRRDAVRPRRARFGAGRDRAEAVRVACPPPYAPAELREASRSSRYWGGLPPSLRSCGASGGKPKLAILGWPATLPTLLRSFGRQAEARDIGVACHPKLRSSVAILYFA